jgi:tetratricopeptide (TPR) repeat protein
MGLFQWLMGLSGGPRGAPTKSAGELLADAWGQVKEGKTRDAVRVCSRIRRRDRTPQVLVEMAQVCLAAEFTLGALGYAGEALDRQPKCAGAICVRGEVLLHEKKPTTALERFKEALRVDPECDWARRRIGELTAPSATSSEEPNGDGPPSEGTRQRRPPETDEGWARYQLAEMLNVEVDLYSRGRYREALPIARRTVQFALLHLGEQDPDTATSLINLGTVMGILGDLAGARPYLERAVAFFE